MERLLLLIGNVPSYRRYASGPFEKIRGPAKKKPPRRVRSGGATPKELASMQTSEYACPRRACQAQPNEPCVDRSGRPRAQVHAGRERLDPVVRIERLRATKRARSWWLTVARGGSCEGCERRLEVGDPIVYLHLPRTVFCRACADKQRISYQASGTWMRHVAAQRRAA